MATDTPSDQAAASAPRSFDVLAALLSYIVPGLGQIYQGRIGKGLLFMVSLLGMFFFGMHLGDWKNVYLPPDNQRAPGYLRQLPGRLQWVSSLVNDRLAFAGQFWIGAAAWPAILQYAEKWPAAEHASEFWREFEKTPSERSLNELQAASNKRWDLGWVYTVIAGVLNILVIYDALAGPAFVAGAAAEQQAAKPAAPQEAVVA